MAPGRLAAGVSPFRGSDPPGHASKSCHDQDPAWSPRVRCGIQRRGFLELKVRLEVGTVVVSVTTVFSVPLVNWNGEAAPVTREPPGRVQPTRQSPHRVGAAARTADAQRPELRPRRAGGSTLPICCAPGGGVRGRISRPPTARRRPLRQWVPSCGLEVQLCAVSGQLQRARPVVARGPLHDGAGRCVCQCWHRLPAERPLPG